MAGYIGSGASVVSSGAERKKVFDITTNTTSLTGLNYTVGKVHVYHNGVRLVDGTDYTATNSTSITLTVAAVSGDQVVVVSYASYQVALSGIDDQSNATAITIDSSENVLAGKSSQTIDTVGVELLGSLGKVHATRDGGASAGFNRKTSDGDIAVFYKDGSAVGSIGTSFGDITIGGKSGFRFDTDSSQYVIPYNVTDNAHTTTVDLGTADRRFKDAYLSGGVYLGGTGAANYLDDFETGSFTPYFTSSGATPSLTYTTQGGTYVIVGNLVTIWIKLRINNISSVGSGNLRVGGLPFAPLDACAETGGSVGLWLSMASASGTEIVQQRSGNTQLFVLQNTTNSAHSVNAMANGGYLRCTASYTTA